MFKRLFSVQLGSRIINFARTPRRHKAAFIMTSVQSDVKGLPLPEVVNELQKFADLSLAADWDNVGLLVEPTEPKNVSHILLTNDLTEDVMNEALEAKTDLIITYHPLIFQGLKSVTTKTWKEKIVAKCLENKIAVYSPHTTFDSKKGGVNDWLAGAFEKFIDKSTPIVANEKEPTYGMGRLCTLKAAIHVDEAVDLVKKRTELNHVRLARARKSGDLISTIALCAGSGASLLKGIPADLYLTGEMLHHDVLEAVHNGAHVILTNHSDSERGYLKTFAATLEDILRKSVKINVSERDADPLITV